MPRRLLNVEVIRAKNISGYNKKTGTSDAYCVVTLTGLSGRQIPAEKFSTPIRPKSLAPEWDQNFVIGECFNLYEV